jgi:hypothetical protein
MRLACLLAFATLPSFSACSTPERLPAVPEELTAEALIPNLPGVRYILNEQVEEMYVDVLERILYEREHLTSSGHVGNLPPAHYLALSGGGDNGAFGAGLLAGWTEAGDRPEFQVVTGISIGAMIAPFAFIGSSQDETLEKLFTTLTPDDVYEERSVLAILFDDAAADGAPMRKLVETYIDEAMLARIAEEYRR